VRSIPIEKVQDAAPRLQIATLKKRINAQNPSNNKFESADKL
jgi:hypothetical protein